MIQARLIDIILMASIANLHIPYAYAYVNQASTSLGRLSRHDQPLLMMIIKTAVRPYIETIHQVD